MNHYQTLQRAHTTDRHNRYYRYELGQLVGKYRNMPALIVDEQGLDGLGLDIDVGGIDDRWCVLNLFDELHRYIDSVAINGAMDKDHATSLALSQFDHLNPAYVTLVANDAGVQDSFDGMQWHSTEISRVLSLDSQNVHYLPIINKRQLSEEQCRLTADRVMWDSANMPVSHGGSISRLFLDIQKHDAYHELTDKFELSEALLDINAQELGFDAVADTYNRLDIFKERLFNAMAKAPKDGLSVTGVTMTKPFKRQGVANVAMVFELSDGQTISIWFHNPDATPAKIGATDIMVSWKWLLNKRDVTGVLNPANSDSVQHADLARRMMLLASKNSKRFAAAQRRKNENLAKLERAEQEVQAKMNRVDELDFQIKKAKERLEAMGQKVTATPAQEKVNDMSVIKEVLVDVDNEVIGATDTPEERLNAKPTQEIIHNPQDKPRVEMTDDESIVSGVIDEFVLKGGVVGETGEDDKRIHNHAFATLEQAQAFIQKLYGNADDVPSQDEPYDEVFLAITYTDKDGKQHKKERWTSLIIKDHDTMFNPFSQTIADYLWDDLVALGIDPTQVQGKLAVSDTSVDMEELTAQQIKDEYKSRFENKDHEWLSKYQKQISVIFENRINAVKAELRKYGFTDDGAYRMEKGRTLLHIDGGDLDWIFVSYNFDGDMKGSVHDMLDKKAEEVAKEIILMYESATMPTDTKSQTQANGQKPIEKPNTPAKSIHLSTGFHALYTSKKSEFLYDGEDVFSASQILDDDEVEDANLTDAERQLTRGKTVAFARAMIAIDKIAKKNGWKVLFGDFSHSVNNASLFDNLDTSKFDVIAQVSHQDKICRVSIDEQGYCHILYGATGGKTIANKAIHYQDTILLKVFYHAFNIDKDIELSDLNDKQKALLDKYQTPLKELDKYGNFSLSLQVDKVQEWERMFNGAVNGNTDDLAFLVKNAKDHSRMSATRKALGVFTNGELTLNSTVNQTKSEQLIRAYFADTNAKLAEIEQQQAIQAEQEKAAQAKQERLQKEQVLQAKHGKAYQWVTEQGLGTLKASKALTTLEKQFNYSVFGVLTRREFVEKALESGYVPKEITQSAKTDYYLQNIKENSQFTITKTEYDYAQWLWSNMSQTQDEAVDEPNTETAGQAVVAGENVVPEPTHNPEPTQENEPMNEPTTQNPNYTQADIDYLQSIIDGTLDLETVDFDRLIAIGEKDDTDPLFEQANDVISEALDKATQGE